MLDSRTSLKMDALKNHDDDSSLDTSNTTSGRSRRSGEKYGLRPRTIIKRLQQERVRQEVPVKTVRTKSRPAPLSKYRRKTANARERHRMKEINNAFEMLRKVLPDAMDIQAASCSMTKITTLRLAVNYIRALSEVLADDNEMDLCSVQNSIQTSIENTLKSSFQHSFHTGAHVGHSMVLQYETAIPHFSQHYVSQYAQLPDLCSSTNTDSSSGSFSASRGSLGSTSDLEELLSDDSGLLEDNLDVFNDIPTLSVADPFEILLATEKDTLTFANAM